MAMIANEYYESEVINMSKKGLQNFEGFMSYCQEHPEAMERLKKLDLTNPRPVMEYAQELGFIFDEQDMKKYAKKALGQKEELSDEDLEQVAGGVNEMTLTTVYVAVVIPPVSLAVRK